MLRKSRCRIREEGRDDIAIRDRHRGPDRCCALALRDRHPRSASAEFDRAPLVASELLTAKVRRMSVLSTVELTPIAAKPDSDRRRSVPGRGAERYQAVSATFFRPMAFGAALGASTALGFGPRVLGASDAVSATAAALGAVLRRC